ncbi:MAG: glycerol kinase GlpK [Oscillospiraceae bacterium]|jgi:glycerol kinase
MSRYILSIDQGTSGTKALLFDDKGRFVSRHSEVHSQFYPNPGWVEHDAEEIFEKTVSAIDSLIEKSGVLPSEIAACAITNQRETVVVWDKQTGKPVCNAIVWQCSRASEICDKIEAEGYADIIKEKTGLVLSPYYSAAKIKWVLDNIPNARKKAEKGELVFGTIDSWLIYKLTGGRIHATDCSNASRTQLMKLKTLSWDEEILKIFTIPKEMAPEILSSDSDFGEIAVSVLSGKGIRISGALGDSHAALFGQNCFERGSAKVTYGTGSSIMMNIGKSPYYSKNGLVTSVGWKAQNEIVYVAEGNINCSAATIKWLVDDLELIPDSKSSEAIAASVPDTGGVYFVPAFVGLGTPYWDSEATALITGITRGTKKSHIVRAALEAIAYQVRDIIDIMKLEAGAEVPEIRVDGGASRNAFLMQFQADILSTTVVVNRVEEICAIGAAYMAGISVGLWSGLEALKKLRTDDSYFISKMKPEYREEIYNNWRKAVSRTLAKY